MFHLSVSICATKKGSGNTYLISTDNKKYIAKMHERVDFLRIYEKSSQALIRNGFRMSRIIKTKSNDSCTDDGVALYEFIDGDCLRVLNWTQTRNAIRYVKKFNEVLRTVSFSSEEIENKNAWDFAKSIDFLSGYFMNKYRPLITDVCRIELITAINILLTNKDKLDNQPRQLIHSDLGADNFVFCGNEVESIIDFTP